MYIQLNSTKKHTIAIKNVFLYSDKSHDKL